MTLMASKRYARLVKEGLSSAEAMAVLNKEQKREREEDGDLAWIA